MFNNIGIAGLGLIGASLAKAFNQYTDCTVLGWNRTHTVTEQALADGTIQTEFNEDNIADLDLLIVALFPQACVDYVLRMLPFMKKGTVIVDIAGVKSTIEEQLAGPCKEAGVIFVGGHPMAGLEVIGYDNSFADLFKGASMILVPNESSDDTTIINLKSLFTQAGFGMVIECDSAHHDKMIGFTSQLCHVISNTYMKNEASEFHKGFSGGSYRDLSRVAKLNEHMWNELFLLNKKALVAEIDEFMGHMQEMRDAIAHENNEQLTELLKIGRERKETYL